MFTRAEPDVSFLEAGQSWAFSLSDSQFTLEKANVGENPTQDLSRIP